MFSLYKNREKGNVTIIVALAMIAMVGIAALVVDTGLLFSEKAKLII